MLNPNALFAEQVNIVAKAPADLSGASGIGAFWMSMKNYRRCTILLLKAAGGAGEPPTITVQQAKDVSGGSAKNLVSMTRIDKKEHATALEGIGTWTAVAQAAAATFAGTAASQGLYAIDIRAEDLDLANGFDCISASIADVGTTAQLGGLIFILWGARYEPPLSPLVN